MQDFTTNTARQSRINISDLTGRSDAAGLRQFGIHVGLLCLTGLGIALARDSWLLLPAMIVHGVVQVALFAGLHETVHRTAFRSRWLNDAVASLIGLVAMLPARYFRRYHFAHHRHTQDPERDPELAAPKPTNFAQYARYLSGYVYWRERLKELLRHARGAVTADFIPENERGLIAAEARWHLAIYVVVLGGALVMQRPEPLLFWLGPAILGQPFLRAYLLTEHTGCPQVADMFRNTRTTYSNGLVRLLMWNMPYHTEHHAFPAVPFHALARLNERIAGRLQVVASGYGAFHRTYATAIAAGNGAAFANPPVVDADEGATLSR